MGISKDALTDLGSISKSFPLSQSQEDTDISSMMSQSKSDDLKINPTVAECGCLLRTEAPDPPVIDNIESYSTEELRQILMNHYKSSTFNVCPHQKLPLMHGPELELHVDPTVKPHVCHTPAPVLAHWEKQVKADLQRDVDLGVLEKVGPNVPVTWCARMILQRKHNGDPRRTIDFQPLNRACRRQTHHTAPPLQQAQTVPHNTSVPPPRCHEGKVVAVLYPHLDRMIPIPHII